MQSGFERMMSSAREGRPTLILDFSTSPLHVKLNEQWGVRNVPGDQHDCWPHSSLPGATQQRHDNITLKHQSLETSTIASLTLPLVQHNNLEIVFKKTW